MGSNEPLWRKLGEPDPDSVKHELELKEKAEKDAAKHVYEPMWNLVDKETGYVLETNTKPRDLEWVKVK